MAHTAHKNGHWRGAFGRLHQRQLFPTIVTKQAPMRTEGRILHPTKDRFVTIREVARAQTFHDSYVFDPKRVYALTQVSAIIVEQSTSIILISTRIVGLQLERYIYIIFYVLRDVR